ncbi:MAG: hypothetical protein K0S32_3858 [Bacteroidetes bacterium]|jgi:hypothetical protein|nr:hypothetical protein [Bacteroidota bacterium]
MKTYNLPFLEELNLDSLKDYYSGETVLNGHEISIDLNIETKTIAIERLDIVKNFLQNIVEYNSKTLIEIKNDFESDGTVKEYVEHHMEEIEELSDDPQEVLKVLHLCRVGFYPDSDENFAVFDYTIGEDLTNYLVVVFFKSDGTILYITEES